jgi:ferredoxin
MLQLIDCESGKASELNKMEKSGEKTHKNQIIMKTVKLIFWVIVMVITGSISASAQSVNEVQIGTYSNGEITITNTQYVNNYFNNFLKHNGTIGDFVVEHSPDNKSILLYAPVSGNTKGVNGIGITLSNIKGKVYFLNAESNLLDGSGGPGVGATVTCTGEPCNSCSVKVTSWTPFVAACVCYQNVPPCGGSCKCNMSISVNATIGL